MSQPYCVRMIRASTVDVNAIREKTGEHARTRQSSDDCISDAAAPFGCSITCYGAHALVVFYTSGLRIAVTRVVRHGLLPNGRRQQG
jgi:hypothetical protein